MKLTVIFATALVFSTSCSLDYGKGVFIKDKVPEFVFINSSFTRYENNKKTMALSADRLEQYKSDSASFALNSQFTTWNDNNEIQTEGSCEILTIKSKQNIYSLHNNIEINNTNPEIKINASNLKWNSDSEQLISTKDETVTIHKDDVIVSGKGFSASSITYAYNFESDISGSIIQNEAESDNSKSLDNSDSQMETSKE